jgi:hypothetical protein
LNVIYFRLVISPITPDPPTGYLFLFPSKDLRTASSSFKWPECPAYWSLDPLGVERLSTAEATSLRFPSIQLTIDVGGYSWDASVYAGLRQFHQAKGFDADSQDVARHIGDPLYQLAGEVDAPFAHGKSTTPKRIVLLRLINTIISE